MFAKLKKKIEQESGPIPELERTFNSPGPGLASPVRSDPPSGFSSPVKDKDETDSTGSAASLVQDGGRPEPSPATSRKQEQMKKLESKVSELAAIIKEKNRSIEKLETALEKQQDILTQKIQDLNEQYQASRAKMAEGFTLALQKKDEEMKKHLSTIEKSKEDLQVQLEEAASFRTQFYKRRDERDELKDLASQELGKLKHLLLKRETELKQTQTELLSRDKQFQQSQTQVTSLEDEVHSLMEQVSQLTCQSEEATEENQRLTETLETRTAEKDSVLEQLQTLQEQLKKKSEGLSKSQGRLSDLEIQHQALKRNSDMDRQKTTTLLEEKSECITHLQEKVSALERRIGDSQLSGDERVTAVEQERQELEEKLAETREQLTQVKSSWSEKITSLEHQISNLNRKIIEDGEELAMVRSEAETVQEELRRQLEGVQAEYRCKDERCGQLECKLAEKELVITQQREELEAKLQNNKQQSAALHSELNSQVASLQRELEALREAKQKEKDSTTMKLSQLETFQEEWLEKEIDHEKQITQFEDRLQVARTETMEKQREYNQQAQQLREAQSRVEQLNEKVQLLEGQKQSSKKESTQLESSLQSLRQEIELCTKERDELLLRNATMSQEREATRRQEAQLREDLEKELEQKQSEMAELQETVAHLQALATQHENKVEDLHREHQDALGAIQAEEVKRVQQEVHELEQQVTEKNKTIKSQQQRIADLRKTLQKELKVQTLPNDETLEVLTREPTVEPAVHRTPVDTGNALVGGPPSSPAFLSVSSSSTRHVQRHTNSLPFVNSNSYDSGGEPAAFVGADHRVPPSKAQDDDTVSAVSLHYLKHVILKFMLSRESEAIHLIKAVSTLLHFSPEEQKLIHDTLEYKMSWFGTRPSPGQGQLSKIIPPSY